MSKWPCEAIFNIYTSIAFQWCKEHPNASCFDPCNRILKFWESQKTPKSQSRECEFHPHTSLDVGLWQTISCSFFIIHFEQFQRLQMHYLKIYKTCLKWKVKKIMVEELKLQNRIEHLWKNPKHNPFHFEKAYLVHFPLNCSVFYRFGYVKWKITKLF